METPPPSWQSTIIAVALIGLVGAIFIAVYEKDGIDSALKAWAAIGTLVGIVTGVLPTYFFTRATASAANARAEKAEETADQERARREKADDRAQLVLGAAPANVVDEVRKTRPDLF